MIASVITVQGPLRPLAVALTIADRLGVRQQFWASMLALTPNPESGNAAAALAVRTYVETRLEAVCPDDAVAMIERLLGPDGSWGDMSIAAITDASIGQALTMGLKSDLVLAITTYSRTWLESVSAELALEAE